MRLLNYFYPVDLGDETTDRNKLVVRDPENSSTPKNQVKQLQLDPLALQQAATAISASLDLQQVLTTITQEITHLFGKETCCAIFEWRQADDALELLAKDGDGVLGQASSSGSIVALADYPLRRRALDEGLPKQVSIDQPNSNAAEVSYLQSTGGRSLLIMPLLGQGQTLGLVTLVFKRVVTFSDDDVALIQLLINQAANVIQHARLYQQAQQKINGLTQTEAQLQVSEEKFKAIFQESLDAILIIEGTSGEILSTNRTAERVLGYKNGALLGQHFSILLPPPSSPDLLEALRIYDAVFEAQEFVRADGSRCPVDLTVTVIPWGQNKAVLTTLRDISERKQAEEALDKFDRELFALQYTGAAMASSLDLKYLLNTIVQEIVHLLEIEACIIFEWDQVENTVTALASYRLADKEQRRQPADPTTLESSLGLTQVLHHRTQQHLKANQPDIDPTELAYLEKVGIKTLLRLPMESQNQVIGLVEVHETRQDRHFSGDELRLAQLLANQAAIAIQTTRLYQQAQQEIAERKRVEEHLREEQNFASAIFNTANAMVTVIDLKGRIIRFNRACEQILGYTADEVRDKVFWDIILAPEEVNVVKVAVQQALQGNTLSKNENFWLTKTGERRLIAWSCSALADRNNTAEYVICIGIDITERKHMEERLQSSQELFSQVVLSISDHIYVTEVTAEGKNINKYISPNVEDLTGYPLTKFMDAWSFWPSVAIHPEDREIAAAQARQLMESGYPSEAEYRIIRADNQVIWVRDSGRVEAEGTSKVVYGLVSDITERKQRELELEAIATIATALRAALTQDEMLTRILDPILDLLQVEGAALDMYNPVTGETTIELARGTWEDVIGTRTVAGKGMSGRVITTGEIYVSNDVKNDEKLRWPRVIGGLTAVACVPLVAQAQTVGVLWVGRRNLITADTVRLLTAISDIAANALYRAMLFEQLQDSNAELVRLTAVLEDLVKERTIDLEQAVMEASEARDRIDAILHSVADGLIVTDLENKVVLVNPAAEDILGFKLEEMLGQEIGTGIRDDRLRQIVRGTLNQYINGYEIDIELEDPRDGQIKIMRAHTSLVDDRQGNPLGTVTIIQDVTAIREVDRMKTEFITTAAHEFRTPLTSIQGFSEILIARDLDRTRQKRYLSMIHQQATNLAEIVEDLLDVARLEARQGLEVQLKTVNMAELVHEVLLPFIETESDHHIVVEGLDRLPNIKGDPFRLAQVSKNLVSNAIKYSPKGGVVTISGRDMPNYIELSIRDEGIGMTREQQKHLFEKFYRADASNTSISGTGLGLSICKLIVELHDGKISVESEPGKGATVFVRLPK